MSEESGRSVLLDQVTCVVDPGEFCVGDPGSHLGRVCRREPAVLAAPKDADRNPEAVQLVADLDRVVLAGLCVLSIECGLSSLSAPWAKELGEHRGSEAAVAAVLELARDERA